MGEQHYISRFHALEDGDVRPIGATPSEQPGVEVSVGAGQDPARALMAATRLAFALRQTVTGYGFGNIPFHIHGQNLAGYEQRTGSVLFAANAADAVAAAGWLALGELRPGETASTLVRAPGVYPLYYDIEVERDEHGRLAALHYPPRESSENGSAAGEAAQAHVG